jgi:hypothetical protein
MAYKLQRYDGSSWDNLLKDENIEITDSNSYFTGSSLDDVLDELYEDTDLTNITSTTTLTSNKKYSFDTSSSAFTVNFPSSPSIGDHINFIPTSDWSTNNLTVSGNGEKIQGQNDVFLADVDYGFTFTYTGSTFGWALQR